MQRLQSTFQTSMLVLLCLSASVFAAAEGQPLVSLTVPLAVVAWGVVDRRNRTGLGPGWSFALGLAGVGAAVAEFLTGGVEARILAPSHLLAYLIWIILFQHKENRHYWTLLGLTVLQVAIASLLTTDPWLGLAVIVYASCALWTMGVFTLQRAVQRVTTGGGISGDLTPQRDQTAAGNRRSAHSVFAPDLASHVQNSVHLDPTERLVGWHFTGGALVMTVVALSLSGVFFLFIPRVWPSQYQLFNDAPIAGARPLTGFTEDVKLGDMGEILENDELVMEVELFDLQIEQGRTISETAIDPARYLEAFGAEEPLFRGQVMEIYDSARWQRANPDLLMGGRGAWIYGRPSGRSQESNQLRQHIRLQPIGSAMLFGAGRILRCQPSEGTERIEREPFTGTFRRGDEADTTQVFEYDAFSSRLRPHYMGTGVEDYYSLCLKGPPGLERLREFLWETIPPGTQLSNVEIAERLTARLRDSEDFAYSLDLAVEDPTVDPVVDFVFNRKRGHCEYFASTLALLLRYAGIPSRVVSGFKGGQVNAETGRFEVRQLHAHLWVEAYDGQRWIPLDPTPGARDESVAQLQSTPTSVLSQIKEAWSSAWSRGVRLSRADQDRMLYDPIKDGAVEFWNAVRDLRGTSSRLAELLRSLATSPERWISWRGGVAAFVLLLIVAGAAGLVRRVWRWLRRLRAGADASRRTAPMVAFYERFRQSAARAGYERGGAQTPREFAHAVSEQVQPAFPAQTPSIPHFVTESYYRVRYGSEELPDELLLSLQRQLDEFDRQLHPRRSAAAGSSG